MNDWTPLRPARLKDEPLALFGRLPVLGDQLQTAFALPPARHSESPLTVPELSVLDHERIAHGLLALFDGVFLAAEVPYDQMQPPSVATLLHGVVQQLEAASHAG
jgi:hypothetical protein